MDLLPAIGDEAVRRQNPFEPFVEMKVIMSVERDIMDHEGANDVIGAAAPTAVEADAGFRGIDPRRQVSVRSEADGGAGGQAIDFKGKSILGRVIHSTILGVDIGTGVN